MSVLLRDASDGRVIDATVVTIARQGDQIVTSVHGDVPALVKATGQNINLRSCKFSGSLRSKSSWFVGLV